MSSLAFIVYVLWAYLPSPFLHQLGIYYYPNRWWALAIPAWTVMWIVYIYVALASYNVGYLTLPLHRVETLVDEAANVAVVDAMGHLIRTDRPSWQHDTKPSHAKKGSVGKKPVKHKSGGHSRQSSVGGVPLPPDLNWSTLWNEGTDAVMDIPIGGVCEILYGDHGDDVEDAE
jgi:phosphatidylinositol glycan class P protein